MLITKEKMSIPEELSKTVARLASTSHSLIYAHLVFFYLYFTNIPDQNHAELIVNQIHLMFSYKYFASIINFFFSVQVYAT